MERFFQKAFIISIFYLLSFTIQFSSYGQTTQQFARMNSGPLFGYEYAMNEYADSLNLWKPGNPLPAFLLNPDIDYDMAYIFRDFFDPMSNVMYSLRKIIFDRTINVELLKAVINAPNDDLDKLYDPEEHPSYPHYGRKRKKDRMPGIDILWMDFTTRQLARERLDQLLKRMDE